MLPAINVMRAIKDRFDPKNILNPLLYSSRSA